MSYRPHPTRGPGWWVIDYYPEGRKGPRVKEPFKGTEGEAAIYEKRLRGIHVSLAKTAVNPPFKEIAAEFRKWVATNKSENYAKSVGWSLKNLLLHFGIFPPSRITDPLIEQYKAKRKHVPSACNHELDMLQIIINWGADPKRNMCRALPFKIDKLQTFKKLPQTPEPDDFDKLLAQVTANFKQARQTPEQRIHKIAMLMIMYETGMRWIECRHLQWENIRKSDGRLYLGRTKTGEARFTFLSPFVLDLLQPIWKDEGYCFINPRTGKIYTTMGKSLRANSVKAGVKIKGTHILRHSLGTDSVDATGDIQGTSNLLGHSDIKTTTVYTHTATERIKRLLTEVREYRDSKRTAYVVPNDIDYSI